MDDRQWTVVCRNSQAGIHHLSRKGADDYVTKPFDPEELRARIQVGVRIVQLQITLAERVGQLE